MSSFLIDLETLKQLIGLGIWAGFFAGIIVSVTVTIVVSSLFETVAQRWPSRAGAGRAS